MSYYDLKCSDCNSNKIYEIKGEVLCNNCGLVLYDYVYQAEEIIYDNNYDIYDNIPILNEVKVSSKIEVDIKNICMNHLKMTDELFNSTLELFKDVKQDNIFKGEHLNGYIAGCIYYTYKLFNISKQKNDIICYFNLSLNKFNVCCNEIMELLSKKPYFSRLLKETSPEDLLVQMVYKIDSLCNKEWDVIKGARRIINKLNKSIEFNNLKPSKINATIIYIVCKILKIKIMKKNISNALDVSIVTMVKHEKIIQELLKKK
jgi:transcription initiation factor TFIIIB Brf1 subunit/transcription initiation factor TFIIB